MGITLFKRKLKNGRTSLYVNYSKNGKRRKESLGIILEAPRDKTIRRYNNEKLKMAKCIVLQRELSYIQGNYKNLQSIGSPKVICNLNLLDVFTEFIKQYANKDIRLAKASHIQLKEYTNSDILTPIQVTTAFCLGFLKFLNSKYKGYTPSHYFKKFKMFLGYCHGKGLIETNPATDIHPTQRSSGEKNILSPEEINLLASTPCKVPEIKRAFLFACFSGLRWSDVSRLRHENIDYQSRSLTITQQKVSHSSSCATLSLYICNSGMKIIEKGEYPQRSGKVFSLPSHTYTLKILKAWVKEAGIKKHITFHSARHTFITLLVANGTDIKTVSSLAGHSTTKHTETYIHALDKNKKKAIEKLPQLPYLVL